MTELDYKKHASYYYFETQFECPECKEQKQAVIAMHKSSPTNKCQTIGFVNSMVYGLMCNNCYYAILKSKGCYVPEQYL